jgi:chromosome segregation protein
MFLKKLEISGFKSFATRTALDFSYGKENEKNHGVTVIVGPNGSGKSNIADAIRWVMGEQSMKNLRGKKSEDIIFAGSGKKTKLGSAKVTLYFDNSDKKIPLDFLEVSVSRRLYRSGESEYLVNGSRARLQDITDFLAAAGVGRQSYTIINQGMADAVLNATPLERKSIIEDAAGVKIYQVKKERSLRKLESTRENLEKVRGILKEIEPHLRSLKRQADKAAQGEEVSQKLKEKQLALYCFMWKTFEREKGELTGKKDELGRQMMNIQREADKIGDEMNEEAKREKEGNNLAEAEKKQRERKAQLNQLDRNLIINEGRIEIEKEKQKNLAIIEEIKIKSTPVDLSYARERIEEIRRDQEKLIKKIEEAEALEDLQDIKEFARSIQQKLYELRADIEKGKIETQEKKEETQKKTEKEIEKSKEMEESFRVIAELSQKSVVLREEIGKMEAEVAEIEGEIEKEIAADRERRQRFFDLERMLRDKQDQLNRAKDKFNEAKISLAKLEVREEDLTAQIKTELRMIPEDLKLDGSADSADVGQLSHEILRLKSQMEHIGGIDPMVVDEYKETQKRFEFLTKESADLESASVSLREVVREMELKIKESFDATFLEINKEFSKYFKIIFGGGNANLTKLKVKSASWRRKLKVGEEGGEDLLDDKNIEEVAQSDDEEPKDEEEIGIEIMANPPGKKISNLSMLSGGERSLTSLALLFSIISHNPPPFAVLDEVEAALDEANSRRFSRILTELSAGTQFVIITHNRETMRQASLLYGVTMGEDGISKLLSVHLDQVGAGGKILK